MVLSLTMTLASMADLASKGPVPVVVSTDCGVAVDDEWAIVHLSVSPKVELRGIVTTHAPSLVKPAAEHSARVARAWVDLLPAGQRPPVEAGSSEALTAKDKPIRNRGVDLILDRTRDGTPARRVAVIAIGAVTDIASALLLDPSLAARIEVVAMGFTSWPGGGDPWNVKNDVKAWQVLMESNAPIVVGDLRAAEGALLMTTARARERLVPEGGWLGGALCVALGTYLANNPETALRITGSRESLPIWDEVTVAFLLGMTQVDEHPRPTLRDDATFDHEHPRGTIRWIRTIDAERLWADLAEDLKRANVGPQPSLSLASYGSLSVKETSRPGAIVASNGSRVACRSRLPIPFPRSRTSPRAVPAGCRSTSGS